MIIQYNTTIKNFDFPLFVTAFANQHQLASLKISKRIGVTCGDFISKCKTEFKKFSEENDYSRESVENYFSVKFNFLRIEKNKISSAEEIIRLGKNTIYVHRK